MAKATSADRAGNMADRLTKAQRSFIMSRIRRRGNRSTELALVKLFRKHRVSGWRRHAKLPGSPDFVFHKQRVIVFADGCFWHSCSRCRLTPRSRAYWRRKLRTNVARDKLVNKTLMEAGWVVVRIWEHLLAQQPAVAVQRIVHTLNRRSALVSSNSGTVK